MSILYKAVKLESRAKKTRICNLTDGEFAMCNVREHRLVMLQEFGFGLFEVPLLFTKFSPQKHEIRSQGEANFLYLDPPLH